jgi:co-chaperonin GroES (HSP10)
MLKPLNDAILFHFNDDVVHGQFVSTSEHGIITYRSYTDSINKARWATVLAVGEKVDKEIKPGSEILIEPLQWTEGFKYDGVEIWSTINDKVMAIRD